MIITAHVSASPPQRLRDYHVEAAEHCRADGSSLLPLDLINACRKAAGPASVPWPTLKGYFDVWKNFDFTHALSYGTWDWNHDFRDNSANVDIALMCLGGRDASTRNFGQWPYTKAHAWMHAALIARVCALKGLDSLESFPTVSGYMNGPLFNVSTHGQRAYQTANPGIDDQGRGYGLYSKDPDCRWDCDVLDVEDIAQLASYDTARSASWASAAWLRNQAHAIMLMGISDFWGLEKAVA